MSSKVRGTGRKRRFTTEAEMETSSKKQSRSRVRSGEQKEKQDSFSLSTSSPAASSCDSEKIEFKKLFVIKKNEKVQHRFATIADYLLNHSILLCGAKMYRLVEIEFYMVSDSHQDCYAHKAPEQKEYLTWYFHRQVPGIDLTFGGGEVRFAGVLLRSVEDLSDGSLIEGTSNVLGLACRNNGCSSKETLIPLLAPGLMAVDEDRKVEEFVPLQDAQTSGSRTLPPKVRVQLTLIHDRSNFLPKKEVYACPRVSLGVKNTPGLEKYHMLAANYRFLTNLREIKAGKPNMVVGLKMLRGWSERDIAKSTGCKLATVEKYLSLLSELEHKNLEEFKPCRSVRLDDYLAICRLVQPMFLE